MAGDEPIRDEDIRAGDPRYDGFRITELWAFVAVDPDDNQEGLPAFNDPVTGQWHPLVCADERRVDSIRGMAQRLANMSGRPLELRRFTTMTHVETIEPRRRG